MNVHAVIGGTYATVLSLVSLIPGATAITGPAALYFSVAGTVLTLTSTWLSYATKKGGCHIGYDSTKKNWSIGWASHKKKNT